jgi:integrase
MARGDGFSIIKRKRGRRELGHWQVRVQVPAEWQRAVGQLEVLRSTGTGDRRIAVQLAPQIVTGLYAEWQRLAGTASSSALADPKAVAVRIGYDSMLAAMEERRKAWPANDADYEAKLAAREADLRRMTRRLQDNDLSQWEGVADRAIAARNLSLDKGSAEYAAFVQMIAQATIDAVNVFNRRHAGELDAAPRSAIVQDAKAREAAKAKSGETLLELFELWGAEMLAKGEKREDTVNQDRKVVEQFAKFVGADRDVRSITPLEVAGYRDTLRDLPPKWTSKNELRNLDMRVAAVRARAKSMPKTAFTTINKHLSTISPLYKWLAGQPKWAGMPNPCNGLFHAKVKGKNPRPPFSTSTLNKILISPLFAGFKAVGEEHLPGDMHADDWRYWVPLGCLFSGARIGEIAQLRLGDVSKERGVWFFHIRHDEEEGLSTKSGKTRVAAVHPMLERIGFLAFHQRRLEAAGGDLDAPMFPELEPNARGQISGMPSRWWRDYLEAIGVKDGADGFGAHSFRHTLADRLRSEAELLDNEIAVCLGHSIKTTTSGYGTLSQGTVNQHKGYMDAVSFDGVKFDHLIAAEDMRIAAAESFQLVCAAHITAIASAA